MNLYVVLSIGCLECGAATDVLGTYQSLTLAQEAHPAATVRERFENGDHLDHAKKSWSTEVDGAPLQVIFTVNVLLEGTS